MNAFEFKNGQICNPLHIFNGGDRHSVSDNGNFDIKVFAMLHDLEKS